MSTFTITPSVAAHKKVFGQFGVELRENFSRGLEGAFTTEQVVNIQEAFDTAFDAVLAQVGKTAVKPVKSAKKTVKNNAKRTELIAQAAELDIVVTDEKIGEIRKLIANKKKANKQAEKKAAAAAKKAAADAKKAEKKAAAAAKKAEKQAAAEAKKAEKKAAVEAKKAEKEAAKKAKAAQPKPLVKRLKHDGEEFTGVNGSYLRVSISRKDGKVTKVNESNWTEEATTAFGEAYPTGFAAIKKKAAPKSKVSPKLAKKKTIAAENVELIKFSDEQISTLKISEMRQMIKDAKKAAKAAKKKLATKSYVKKAPAKLSKEKTDLIATLVGEAVQGIENMSIAKVTPVNEDAELVEDDIDSDDEELELIFPGEDDVDEFEQADQCGLDADKTYYIDEDYNIWDDEESHIGVYNAAEEVIVMN